MHRLIVTDNLQKKKTPPKNHTHMKIRELVYLQATLGLETREALEVLALKFAMAALPMVTLLTLLSTRSRSLRSGLPEPSQRTLPPKFIRRACPAVKARAGPAASVSLDEGGEHTMGGDLRRSVLPRRCREMPFVELDRGPE